MSDIVWKTVYPGERPAFGAMDMDREEENLDLRSFPILYGDTTPTHIRLPANLGGGVQRVRHVETGCACPCDADPEKHTVRWYVLETVIVAECHFKGFMWMSKPEDY